MFKYIWVDILIMLVFVVGIHNKTKRDLVSEFFKLIGVLCATFIALHFYKRLAHIWSGVSVLGEYSDFLAFSILSGSVIGFFYLVRRGWFDILKIDLNSIIDRLGGFIFSIVKSYFVGGLIFFSFLLSGHQILSTAAKKSLSYRLFKKTSINIYHVVYSGFIVNFFPKEPLNRSAYKLLKDLE